MKLPPYARYWISIFELHPILSTEIWIFVGEKSLMYGKNFLKELKPSLALPKDDHFSLYAWPVKDNRVVVTNTGGYGVSSLTDFATTLILSGAEFVTIESEEDQFINFMKR
jgi:hypothetical protein